MWLVIASIFALVATYSWINTPGKNRNGQLALAFWALTFMIFVDHVIGWLLEGGEGEFLEIGLEPLMLSLCMVIPVLAAWEMFVAFDKLGIKILKSTSAKDAKTVEE
jgi:hypothetical protein